jgi:hypothetical protein
VPTANFRVLYCFFVIEHERRKILHCNVTQHPTVDCAAIAGGISRAVPLPVRDLGSGPKIQREGGGVLDHSRVESEAYERAVAMAKRAGGAG